MEMKSPCTFCRAMRAASEGRYEEAIALLDTVLELSPESAQARIQRGKLYALTGQVQKAINEFRVVLYQNYMDVEAHLNLASIYTLHNMYKDAAHHLRFVDCHGGDIEQVASLSSAAWRN